MAEKLEIVLLDAGQTSAPQSPNRGAPQPVTGQSPAPSQSAAPTTQPVGQAPQRDPNVVDAEIVQPTSQGNRRKPPVLPRSGWRGAWDKVRQSRLFRRAANSRIGQRVLRATYPLRNAWGWGQDIGGAFRVPGINPNAPQAGAAAGRAVGAAPAGSTAGATTGATATGAAVPTAAGATGGAVATRAAAAAPATAPAGAAAGGGALALLLNPVTIVIGAIVAAFALMAIAAKKLVDVFKKQADDLEEFSVEIARARAVHEVNMTQAKLERANRLGPEMAQIEGARMKLQESMYDVQTSILELLLKFAPGIKMALDAINVGVRGVDTVVAVLKLIYAQFTLLDFQDNITSLREFKASLKKFGGALDELFGNGTQQTGQNWPQSILNMSIPLPKSGP